MSQTTLVYETLTKFLADAEYCFVCPSPETQGRVVQKRSSDVSTATAWSIHDFFGWSLPCSRGELIKFIPNDLAESLEKCAMIVRTKEDQYRSTIRVSNFYLPQQLNTDPNDASLYYIHSAFPASADSVFFGPDTYLFIEFLRKVTHYLKHSPSSVVDVCCGSGAGAIHMARTYPQAQTIGLDLNPRALSLGGVNAHLAGTEIKFRESDLYAAIPEVLKSTGIDLIVSNPPYIASSVDNVDLPIYADGGAKFGLDISLRIVEEGMKLLSEQGLIVVYTGVAIPTANPGEDAFLENLRSIENAAILKYMILHPDMWPEEIGKGPYADVCRIQVVGAVLRRQA